jgi:hypothetical protein
MRMLPFVLSALLPIAIAGAQLSPVAGLPSVDPYSGGRAAVLAELGYLSFGPFELGTNHDSAAVQQLLPDEPLRWIETEHFRIGCALPAVPARGSKPWLQLLRHELEQLAARMPAVDPKTKVLDGWLRAHLVALRAEQHYAAVVAQLGATGREFPPAPGHPAAAGAEFQGVGPYLGMREKFTILLLEKQGNLAKYTAAHHFLASTEPVRLHDVKFGTLMFAAAGDSGARFGADEEALAASLAFHLAHNLYAGYRSFGHALPAWLPHGLALCHARAVSTEVAVVPVRDDADRLRYRQWELRRQALRKDRSFVMPDGLLEAMDPEAMPMESSLCCWILVDALRKQRAGDLPELFDRLKDPFHERLRFPTHEELFARQRQVLAKVLGPGDLVRFERLPRATAAAARLTARAR